jgi:hypothetical protein
MGWLSMLLGLADPITRITKSIADTRIAIETTKTDRERIHSEETLRSLEMRRSVLIAEAANPAAARMNAGIRFFIAIGPAAYLNKIFLWDKVIGSFAGYTPDMFTTDPLNDPNLANVMAAVLGFYFLFDTVRSASKIIRG